MSYDPNVDESNAYKERRDRDEANEGYLIDHAMRDILQGKFDTDAVREAMTLTRHSDFEKLATAYDDALRAQGVPA